MLKSKESNPMSFREGQVVEVTPGLDEPAVPVEQLDPVVLAVRHQHPVRPVDPDRVRRGELARPGAGPPPGRHVLARGREAVDRRVAVAVGHVDLAVRRDRHVGRVVERRLEAGRVARPERPEPFAPGRGPPMDYGDKPAAAKWSLFTPPRWSLFAPPLTPA